MKIKNIRLLCGVLIFTSFLMFLPSIGEGGGSGLHFGIIKAIEKKIDELKEKVEKKEAEEAGKVKVGGKISLPSGSSLRPSDLIINSPSDQKSIKEDFEFDIYTPRCEKQQLLIVSSSNDYPILLGYREPQETENIDLSARSTAKGLILTNPFFLLTSADQKREILNKAEKHADFGNLVSRISSLIVNDPKNTIKDQEVCKGAVQIAIDVLKSLGEGSLEKGIKALREGMGTPNGDGGPWIEDEPADNIKFMNPECIYYAAPVYPSGSSTWQAVAGVDAKPSLWSYQWGWPPFYSTPPTPTSYSLGQGSFGIEMTKGFENLTEVLSLFNWRIPNGKATISNTGKCALLFLDLCVGIYVTPSFGTLHLKIDVAAAAKLAESWQDGDVWGTAGALIAIMLDNVDNICYWLWQEVSTDVARNYMRKIHGILKNIAYVIKVAFATETGINKAAPFFYDLITAPSPINYFVIQEGGKLTKNVKTSPPYIPASPSPSDGSTGQSVDVVLSWSGGDPDSGDTVTYDIYFEANDSTPDQLISIGQSGTTCNPGTLNPSTHYYWKIVAMDNHGAFNFSPVWDFSTTEITPKQGGISGKVTESDGITPISGALVEVLEEFSSPPMGRDVLGAGTTGTDGKYTISNLSAGKYYVRAFKVGYVGNYTKGVNVSAGSTTGGINIILSPYNNSTITLLSGTLNGATINQANPILTVSPGQSVTGSLNIRVVNNGHSGAVFPVGATTSWGDHSTSYWTIVDHSALGTKDYTVNVNLIAPSSEGLYYIIIAANWELDAGDIMSATNWSYGTEIWNDGNDIASWTLDQVNEAVSKGYAKCVWVGGDGYYEWVYAPSTAIKINVNGGAGGEGTKKWEFQTGHQIFSSPAIGSDGTIYFGCRDGKLYGINPDGTKKWEFLTGVYINCSPAIGSDGTIYVGFRDNKLYAINPDGTKKWEFETGGDVDSSPAIGSDGTIYVGSKDGKLYAINSNGTKKWEFQTGGGVDSSPAIGSDGTIYVGSLDKKLYAINSNGTKKWEFLAGGEVYSSPAIGSDGTIYVGSLDKKLYAINSNGTKKWEFLAGGEVYSSPAIGSDGTIYVGSLDKKLYAINSNGTKKWEFQTGDWVHYSVAISSDGTIYVGSDDGNLYAINPNGTKKWEFQTGLWVYSSPAIGSDGTIYVCACIYDGKLYAIYGSGSLANTPWPMFHHDLQHTGRQ